MNKNLLIVISSFFIFFGYSCVNGDTNKKKNNIYDYESFAVKFQTLKKIEENKPLSDSLIFLDIKLLSSKKEYDETIKRLLKEKRLMKNNGNIIYVFDLMDGTLLTHGRLEPHFHNDKLYKLIIECEVQTGSASLGTIVLFAKLNSLLNSKYSYPDYEDALFMETNAYIYIHGWFGNGKIIELNDDVITYTHAGIEKEIEELKNISESNKNKKVIDDL